MTKKFKALENNTRVGQKEGRSPASPLPEIKNKCSTKQKNCSRLCLRSRKPAFFLNSALEVGMSKCKIISMN